MADENSGNGKKDEPSKEFENFQQLLKQVVSVPKEKVDKRRREEQREKRAG